MVLLVKTLNKKMNICGRQNQRQQEEHQGKIYTISLIPSQAKRKLVTHQTPQVVIQIIYSCGILSKLFKTLPNTVHQAQEMFISPRSRS